jgi:phosphatidate phosphatase PAH1
MTSKGKYELMMELKDDGETIRIYTSGNEKIIHSFVFLVSEEDSVQFICIDGEMKRSDIEKLIANSLQ